jgi:hypothetical protein
VKPYHASPLRDLLITKRINDFVLKIFQKLK